MGSARTTLTASSAVSWDVAVDRARPLGPARTWKRSWTSRSRMRYAAWRPSSASTGRMGRRTVKVRVPSGVGDGQRIRLPGSGAPGHNGGPPGDLYAVVRVGLTRSLAGGAGT